MGVHFLLVIVALRSAVYPVELGALVETDDLSRNRKLQQYE